MKVFEETFMCDCGNKFEWKYVKIDNCEAVFDNHDNLIKNCRRFNETSSQYVFVIVCPYCHKTHTHEIDKH